jgi:hypothetical protein
MRIEVGPRLGSHGPIRELIANLRRKLILVAPNVPSDFVLGLSPSRFHHRIEEATPP